MNCLYIGKCLHKMTNYTNLYKYDRSCSFSYVVRFLHTACMALCTLYAWLPTHCMYDSLPSACMALCILHACLSALLLHGCLALHMPFSEHFCLLVACSAFLVQGSTWLGFSIPLLPPGCMLMSCHCWVLQVGSLTSRLPSTCWNFKLMGWNCGLVVSLAWTYS